MATQQKVMDDHQAVIEGTDVALRDGSSIHVRAFRSTEDREAIRTFLVARADGAAILDARVRVQLPPMSRLPLALSARREAIETW